MVARLAKNAPDQLSAGHGDGLIAHDLSSFVKHTITSVKTSWTMSVKSL